jgi:hypothetical protein
VKTNEKKILVVGISFSDGSGFGAGFSRYFLLE